jgi:AcrR family transcriptional regulator
VTVEMTPLPRGRHGLSREEVERSQRMRLARSMCEVMADKGYARTSVADILRRARVSRETFYEFFESKEDCFMSAFEEAYGHILDATTPTAGEGAPLERFSRVLADYLRALAGDPAAARVFLVEVYAAGPSALARRHDLHQRLVDSVAALIGASSEEDRFAVEAVLAALVQMVTARLAVGDVDGLRQLHGPIVELARRVSGVITAR